VAQVQSGKTDRSTVTLEVPPKLWTYLHKTIEVHEFKLRARKMPNGYIVTLAAVCFQDKIVFGATACSPDDYFQADMAWARALGRARQTLFATENRGYDRVLSLTEIEQRQMPFRHTGTNDRTSLFESVYSKADWVYETVAANAETQAVMKAVAGLTRLFGKRYNFTVETR
jgi:hypothetical protein